MSGVGHYKFTIAALLFFGAALAVLSLAPLQASGVDGVDGGLPPNASRFYTHDVGGFACYFPEGTVWDSGRWLERVFGRVSFSTAHMAHGLVSYAVTQNVSFSLLLAYLNETLEEVFLAVLGKWGFLLNGELYKIEGRYDSLFSDPILSDLAGILFGHVLSRVLGSGSGSGSGSGKVTALLDVSGFVGLADFAFSRARWWRYSLVGVIQYTLLGQIHLRFIERKQDWRNVLVGVFSAGLIVLFHFSNCETLASVDGADSYTPNHAENLRFHVVWAGFSLLSFSLVAALPFYPIQIDLAWFASATALLLLFKRVSFFSASSLRSSEMKEKYTLPLLRIKLGAQYRDLGVQMTSTSSSGSRPGASSSSL